MKNLFKLVLILFLLNSCKSHKTLQTNPAPERVPSSSKNFDSFTHLTSEDKEFIDTLFQSIMNKSQDPVALDSIVRTAVMLGGMGMKLMATFDLKIEKILSLASPTEKDLNYIKNDLSCQLWESSFVQHISQDKITYIQKLILQNKNTELYKRFLYLFISGKNDNPSRALAKANILRVLKWNHENYCLFINCPAFEVSQASHDFPFEVFSDTEMATYYHLNKSKIGFYSNARSAKDEDVGSCYDYPNKRKPNQSQKNEYNWQKRNYTGRELKESEFIVTYDDGPHAEFTNKIAGSWKHSGYKLPAFFWLTQNVINYTQIAVSLLAENFPLALHSYSHADLGNLSSATSIAKLNAVNKKSFSRELKSLTDDQFSTWKSNKLKREIITAKEDYENVINKYIPGKDFKIRHFRLPFGSGMKNTEIGKLLDQSNMNHYFWAIDSLDWNDKNPITIKERILNQISLNKKGIILFHDIHKQSFLATNELISYFKGKPEIKILSIEDLKTNQ